MSDTAKIVNRTPVMVSATRLRVVLFGKVGGAKPSAEKSPERLRLASFPVNTRQTGYFTVRMP